MDGSARLWVNAEGLSPESSLRVELLDELERPLPGYSGDASATLQQSGLRVPVSWNGKSQIAGVQQSFKIKVGFEGRLSGAISFYALYVGK
ncbi:MAG: hypothetical protein HY717_09925 [Planctomycetes bacterium]|nr:hypothetical protein [Planctomycetota bacterium]